jgi:CspA family cold shock protein
MRESMISGEDSCTSGAGSRVFSSSRLRVSGRTGGVLSSRRISRSNGRAAIAQRLTIASGVVVVKEKGVVKWFNSAKGYGFIQRSTGEDVFVHFSAIQMQGYRTLEEGAEVEFEVKTGPKGLQAENVVRVQ